MSYGMLSYGYISAAFSPTNWLSRAHTRVSCAHLIEGVRCCADYQYYRQYCHLCTNEVRLEFRLLLVCLVFKVIVVSLCCVLLLN